MKKNITPNTYNASTIYAEFDYRCKQEDLYEVFKTSSLSTYKLMINILTEKNIKNRGFGNDWDGKFEIRFNPYVNLYIPIKQRKLQ